MQQSVGVSSYFYLQVSNCFNLDLLVRQNLKIIQIAHDTIMSIWREVDCQMLISRLDRWRLNRRCFKKHTAHNVRLWQFCPLIWKRAFQSVTELRKIMEGKRMHYGGFLKSNNIICLISMERTRSRKPVNVRSH